MLPTGTVVFMFSDIEGSTVRWESNRDAMQRALRKHDAVVHDAVALHGGYVFKTVGDEFCTAFQLANDAVEAALAVQRNLAAEDFSEVRGIRVRMAIHAGETDERSGDYYGPPVNRVARLLSTGYGGQVLLSGIVAERVKDELTPNVTLLDLGWHRLKDLEEPEHVYQLTAPGLQTEFPPLKSLNTGAHNLPQQTTSFIGRDDDVAEIERLLRNSALVSVAGVGGVGKTRLALQVAANVLHDFRDGVWFVNLAPISDPSLIASTILSALAVTQASTQSALDMLLSHLQSRNLLIVLDNCEHLIAEAARVAAAILSAAPSVRVLATSREALNIPGEQLYRVPTLGVEEATQLFIDRARAAKPDFAATPQTLPVIEEICRRVDSIALAIELAAPRLRVLSVEELLSRLNERFRVLTGGSRTALPRQKTMHALIDWSYDLLSEEEKTLFRRLSVFSGSFTLEAVSEICSNDDLDEYAALDVLSALVDKSLVVVAASGTKTRYYLLQSIADYARERINEVHECERTSKCHATYYAGFAQRAYDEWDKGPAPDWLERGSAELDNIRGALTWSISEGHDRTTGAILIASAYAIFLRLSLLSEAIGWAERALETVDLPANVRARLQYGLSMLYNNQFDVDRALAAAERAAALYRETRDARGTINAEAQLAQQYARHSKMADARRCGADALNGARRFGDARLLALTLQRYATTLDSDEIEAARNLLKEAVNLFESIGRNEDTGRALVWWAAVEADAENMDGAIEILLKALPLVSGDVKLFATLNVADYLLEKGDATGALQRAQEAMIIAHNQQHVNGLSLAAAFVALAIAADDIEKAAKLLAFARSHFPGNWPPPQYDAKRFKELEDRITVVIPEARRKEIERLGTAFTNDRLLSEALSH